jgi:sporulation protein YlmC with PRC-barrel domain
MNKNFALSALTLAAALCTGTAAFAQIAGSSTTTGVAVVETTKFATGWSVKKTLMGKTIYNDAGAKVGKVEDLIISPERNVSYVIVRAGGFVGIGRHDVAIPVIQIKEVAGKLVMAGATKETIKAMPVFDYAIDTTQRDKFVASAESDIAKGRTKLADLEKKASTAAADAKARIDLQIAAVKGDVKSAEEKLAELKNATARDWKKFETSVSAATARLRKSVETAIG